MLNGELFIRQYNDAVCKGMSLKDMEVEQATGYYLVNYPDSTQLAVTKDINDGAISSVIGNAIIYLVGAIQ